MFGMFFPVETSDNPFDFQDPRKKVDLRQSKSNKIICEKMAKNQILFVKNGKKSKKVICEKWQKSNIICAKWQTNQIRLFVRKGGKIAQDCQ